MIDTLTRHSHEIIISDSFYDEIASFVSNNNFNDLGAFEKDEILKIKYDVEKARKIPAKLAGKIAKTTSLAMIEWEKSKLLGDDRDFLPLLKKVFELKKEYSELIGYKKNPYDALLDDYDRGLEFYIIKPLFENLNKALAEIIDKIKKFNIKIKDDFLYLFYDSKKQIDTGLKVLKMMGIDFESFRQDISAHPFTTTIGINDIRITTKMDENDFKKSFFFTVHEGGHCLYEINTVDKLKKSPFAHLESLSLHESQSRFYENRTGRNIYFWIFFYQEFKKYLKKILRIFL